MKPTPFLTLTNLALLAFQLSRPQPAAARDTTQILRGRGLEIVDEQGRVRASINIQTPEGKYKKPNGKPIRNPSCSVCPIRTVVRRSSSARPSMAPA